MLTAVVIMAGDRGGPWIGCAPLAMQELEDSMVHSESALKAAAKSVLGARNVGRVQFFACPWMKNALGGPFNGQRYRRRMFEELIGATAPVAVVETGTFRGSTTALLAGTGLPVWTVEHDAEFYGYASMRFLWKRRVRVWHGDSRAFLLELREKQELRSRPVFFYLDAHWGDDLPLAEELQIIFSGFASALVMVDDFAVPGTSYGYDSYGVGRELTLQYLDLVESIGSPAAFFPAIPAEQESGAQRGAVVLTRDMRLAEQLEGCETLVPRAAL